LGLLRGFPLLHELIHALIHALPPFGAPLAQLLALAGTQDLEPPACAGALPRPADLLLAVLALLAPEDPGEEEADPERDAEARPDATANRLARGPHHVHAVPELGTFLVDPLLDGIQCGRDPATRVFDRAPGLFG